ncbi:Coenzyme F420 hydrogenase/dehydrogenase, beta subunit C-terminal domain [Pseudarthrobacter oxydans]
MRPDLSERRNAVPREDECRVFNRVCPGKRVTAPPADQGTRHHEVFGRYVQVWEGWAVDPEVRRAGSSGGVLTAISSYLSMKKRAPARVVAMDSANPSRSVPIQIMSRAEALNAAGSRYAPVSVGAGPLDELSSITGKPCEVSAIRATRNDLPAGPVLLSFFCAGTPSQKATDELVGQLGHSIENLTSSKYRGDGWPGQFVVESSDGSSNAMSYEDSWGAVLGKQLQDRCKICVDGTGESADVAVGDYWASDQAGYPLFADADGRSVVIARTPRGLRLVEECVDAGILEVRPILLDDVAKIQPLQVKRRRSLPGRLLGRILVGRSVPRYPGYKLARTFFSNLGLNLRAVGGTVRRNVRAGTVNRSR